MKMAVHFDKVVSNAFAQAGLQGTVRTVAPQRDGFDLQCNSIMAAAKAAGLNPRAMADIVADHLRLHSTIETVEVSGPGFLNIRLTNSAISRLGETMVQESEMVPPVDAPERIVLDFGGPNVAKPLHVGHLRSLVIGESLSRILTSVGHHVVTDIHLGDWGLQMGMLISELALRFPGIDPQHIPFSPDVYDNLYSDAAAACKQSPERMALARQATVELQGHNPYAYAIWVRLRNTSFADHIKAVDALKVHFDYWRGESFVADRIPVMLAMLKEKGLLIESDGAKVIDVSEPGDMKPMPPLLLEKSDGAALYGTTDLATLELRAHEGARRVVYVVDQRQSLHLEQVFRAGRKMGLDVICKHVGFGTVNGKDGKPFKTREGGTPKLSDMLDEVIRVAEQRLAEQGIENVEALAKIIGIGAVKFADLSTHRLTGYVFAPERFVSFEGRTGPYIQYACVRIKAIKRKADDLGHKPGVMMVETSEERDLVMECLRYPQRVHAAAEGYAPNEIADYLFGLAQAFSRFYANTPVLNAENPEKRASRLQICDLVGRILSHGLFLLGISVPDKM